MRDQKRIVIPSLARDLLFAPREDTKLLKGFDRGPSYGFVSFVVRSLASD